MLIGLSVHEGSLAGSVRWRRLWWRVGGVALCALSVACAGFALSQLQPTPDATQWPFYRMSLACLLSSAAFAVEGVRLLRGARKRSGSLRAHHAAIGLFLAAACVLEPLCAISLVPALGVRYAKAFPTSGAESKRG